MTIDSADTPDRGRPEELRSIRWPTGWLGSAFLGYGLAGSAVWAVAVEMAMPSGFDPAEECGIRYGLPDNEVDIKESWFPPTATCTFHGVHGDSSQVTHNYMSPTTSAHLTIIIVGLVLVIVCGLALLGFRLLAPDPAAYLRQDRPSRPRERGGTTVRAIAHPVSVSLLGAATGRLSPSLPLYQKR